ncbi:hypothetical protein HK102_003632 [Quaeritorhiza haematococci]|nr:hypothetical protein HK102_003632 [Quaeritorhiza haematococci]
MAYTIVRTAVLLFVAALVGHVTAETLVPGTYGNAVSLQANTEIEIQYSDGFQLDYQSDAANSLTVTQNMNPSKMNPAGTTPAFPYSWVVALSNTSIKFTKAKVELQFRGVPANTNPSQIRFGLHKPDGSWDLNVTGEAPELDQKDQAVELERVPTIVGEWRAFVVANSSGNTAAAAGQGGKSSGATPMGPSMGAVGWIYGVGLAMLFFL